VPELCCRYFSRRNKTTVFRVTTVFAFPLWTRSDAGAPGGMLNNNETTIACRHIGRKSPFTALKGRRGRLSRGLTARADNGRRGALDRGSGHEIGRPKRPSDGNHDVARRFSLPLFPRRIFGRTISLSIRYRVRHVRRSTVSVIRAFDVTIEIRSGETLCLYRERPGRKIADPPTTSPGFR